MSSHDAIILEIINTLQPFLRYPGGKSRLSKRIVKEFPMHKTYVEPMVGGGSVYFAKTPSEREVISDIDPALMNFYRNLKKGNIKRCNLTPNKNRFEKIRSKSKNGSPLDHCEYLYLNKMSYGGKMGTTMDPNAWKNCKGEKAKKCGIVSKNQDKYAERLGKTKIEHGDFKKVVEKHDSKDTLFYLDPPYVTDTKDHYRYGTLTPEEVKKVTDRMRGKLVMSYNNTPRTRKLFCNDSKYNCKTVKTNYSINKSKPHNKANELLIKNF